MIYLLNLAVIILLITSIVCKDSSETLKFLLQAFAILIALNKEHIYKRVPRFPIASVANNPILFESDRSLHLSIKFIKNDTSPCEISNFTLINSESEIENIIINNLDVNPDYPIRFDNSSTSKTIEFHISAPSAAWCFL